MFSITVMEGRLVSDPELRKLPSGLSLTNCVIACEDDLKRNGEKATTFMPCTFFGSTAENVAKYFRKGRAIIVTGRIKQEEFGEPDPTIDGKQPSIENRVYSPDGTSTAVTASFPTKYNIGLRIRKLTPRECFRLMGVSDDRSQSLISSFSDSVLYHLAGDSIVTTCLMAIFSQCLDIDWVAKAKEAKLVSHK